MAVLKQLLIAGSLLAASLAKPVERRFDSGDDDTPLPLVIWHGKRSPTPIGKSAVASDGD